MSETQRQSGAISGVTMIVIVKRDRFCAYALGHLAIEVFPNAKIVSCHTAVECLSALSERPADIGLFGLGLPDIDGLDLIIRVLEERLVSRLFVVSTRNDEHSRQILRRTGIIGYFDSLSDEGSNLRGAIRAIGQGGCYFSPDRRSHSNGQRPRLSQILSDTEMKILAVIGDGSTDQDAAGWLGLSPTTVHSHRQHIMRKLDIQTRAALMRAAMERGVVRFSEDRVLHPGMERVLAARHRHACDGAREDDAVPQPGQTLRASSF